MSATRFELRIDGYGWHRIWDREMERFLPDRHQEREDAEMRVWLLNQGAAVPIVHSQDARAKPRRGKKPQNLKLF